MKKQILAPSLNQQARQRGKNSHVAIGQRRPKIGLYRYIFNLDRRKTAVCKQFAMRFQDMICQENVEYGQTGFKRQRSDANILLHFTYPENRWKKVESQILSWNKNHQVVCGVHHAILAGLDFRTFQNIQRSKVFWIMYCFKVSGPPAKTHNKSGCLGHSLGWDLWEESFV